VITDAVSLRKTTDAYLALKVEAQCDRCFMIGDQLDRDIQAASAAGFSTFYFPGGFTPYWVRDLDTSNTRQVSRYDAIVPEILAE
jgi:putative hydrolase of the HAD superfamily